MIFCAELPSTGLSCVECLVYAEQHDQMISQIWLLPVIVGMFGILYTKSDSRRDDSHEDGAFQTPNPCDCWHFGDCEWLQTTVTEIPRVHGPPPSIGAWGGQERQTPDHIRGLGFRDIITRFFSLWFQVGFLYVEHPHILPRTLLECSWCGLEVTLGVFFDCS